MKKMFVMLFLFAGFVALGQVKKPAAPKAPVPAAGLKNLTDSASYAIGISVANFYTQQGLSSMNASLVARAINDVLGKKKILLSDNDANAVMMRCINQAQATKAKGSIEAGEKFLSENKNKQGVKTTSSGLQYEVLAEGSGPKPSATDTVTVNYVGTLLNGAEFDNSYKRGEPISFPLDGVIRGWTEGVQLMPAGSKYKFYIPYQLGYGTNETGSIPAGSLLIFEIELLSVKGK